MLSRAESKWALALVIFFALRVASAATAGAIYVLLAALAFSSSKGTLRAFLLAWLTTLWNPALGPVPISGAAGRFLVIGAAAGASLLRWRGLNGRAGVSRPVFVVVCLGVFLVTHSFFVSALPDVSTLKSASWAMAMAAAVASWGRMSVRDRVSFEREMYAFLVVVMVISLPWVGFPSGYSRNGSGFQGILSHPQAFGPTMAILASWTLSLCFLESKPSLGRLTTLGICAWFILASEARTAGVAVLIGVAASVGLIFLRTKGNPFERLPGLLSRRLYSVTLAGVLLGVVQAPLVEERFESYMSKNRGPSGLFEAYETSRGELIESMVAGFKKSPLVGNGFGLPTATRRMEVKYDPNTGLPIAAAVEKGVLPLAVLEDLGVVGFVLVAAWLGGAARRSAKGGLVPLGLVSTALAINLGEANFFSPGGLGMLFIVCVSLGASLPLTPRQV